MLDLLERKQIIALMQREVVPAIGCTEPVAVALCVAKATETLGTLPEHISLYLSANILKNAMGVGIPGTGMIGLPIATALGALIGKSEYQLEVLKDSCPEAVEKGKAYIAEKRISISLKETVLLCSGAYLTGERFCYTLKLPTHEARLPPAAAPKARPCRYQLFCSQLPLADLGGMTSGCP